MPSIRTLITSIAAVVLVLAGLVGTAAAQDSTTITPDRVGPATLGVDVETLAEQLGSDYEISDELRITVDFTGHVVRRNGEVHFRAAKTDDSDLLTLFIVSNPMYRTAEGVGPGSTIADAEAVYGDATLRWNPDDESREFVEFADQPPGRIQFRTPGIGGNNVGLYGDDEFETTEYEDDAEIASVWISCIPGTDCPPASDADPDDADPDDADPDDADPDDADPDDADPDDADPDDADPDDADPDDADPDDADPDDADPDDGGAGASDPDDGGALADTGASEQLLAAVSAVCLLCGGAALVLRRHLSFGPAWLTARNRR